MDIWEFVSSQHFCWSHRWLWRLQFAACSHWSVETTHCGFPGVSLETWHRIIHFQCLISAMLCHWVFALSHQGYLPTFQARGTHEQFCKFRLRGLSLEPKENNPDWPRKLSSREGAMENCSECVEVSAAHTNDNPRELTQNSKFRNSHYRPTKVNKPSVLLRSILMKQHNRFSSCPHLVFFKII